MKNTINDSFITPEKTGHIRWQSDRPSNGARENNGVTEMQSGLKKNLPEDCNSPRYMERYLTWIAWKGQDTVLEDVRIRSWSNAFRSLGILFKRRTTDDYKSLFLHTLVPVVPLRNWIQELSRIWNGVSRKAAEEIAGHIHVPGYWWKVEASENGGIRTLRFIGWKA